MSDLFGVGPHDRDALYVSYRKRSARRMLARIAQGWPDSQARERAQVAVEKELAEKTSRWDLDVLMEIVQQIESEFGPATGD